MWDKIVFVVDDFFNRLEPGHFEGMILYMIGSISVLYLEIKYRHDWATGLKGENGRWEAPEIVIRLWILIFPHFIMSSGFLQINWPTEAWYFMAAVLMFVLLGRERLEKLIQFRLGGNSDSKPPAHEKSDKASTPDTDQTPHL
jgi:hypothetical protein